MQLNWFLKSKLQLRTWLEKLQIEDWFGLWHRFSAFFLLNETARFVTFVQNGTVHAKRKEKEKTQTVLFWTALWVFFFPWTREAGEGEDFSSSVFHLHFSLKKTSTNPTCPKTISTCWRGSGGRPLPYPSPVFAYKNRGVEQTKKKGQVRTKEEERRERVEERGKIERKKEKEETEKRIKTEERERRKKTEPLPPPQTASATTSVAACRLQQLRRRQQPPQVSPSLLLFSPAWSLPHLHCSRSMWTVEGIVHTGWVEPNPCIWARFGPTHRTGPDPAKLKKKI